MEIKLNEVGKRESLGKGSITYWVGDVCFAWYHDAKEYADSIGSKVRTFSAGELVC